MTLFVDELKDYPNAPFHTKQWCHLISDLRGEEGTQELLLFAERLGLRPGWIQHKGKATEHFDLVRSKRALAVRLGAVEKTSREISHEITIPKLQAQEEERSQEKLDG